MRSVFVALGLTLLSSCAALEQEVAKLPNPPETSEPSKPSKPLLTSVSEVKTLLSECVNTKVYNRGYPNQQVVFDLIKELQETPDSIFEETDRVDDIYTSISKNLGPWKSLKHRKAAMGDVLIVLGGFESSWDYHEGRDASANNTKACTEEAGLYQTSGNANGFSKTLVSFQAQNCGTTDCDTFRSCMKRPVLSFVHGHTMRLLRYTIRHHGPIVNGKIHAWLKKSCVDQIEAVL